MLKALFAWSGQGFGLATGLACMAIAMSATAQERLPFRGNGPDGEHIAGARFIKPGALLLASFDQDHDLIITPEEIEAGAKQAFIHADADENGYLTPIEQRNWATRISSERDILGNPSLFASAMPGMVTEAEFIAGLKIFSQRFTEDDGTIAFANLTFEAHGRDRDERESGEPEVERLRRPTVSDRPDMDGYRD